MEEAKWQQSLLDPVLSMLEPRFDESSGEGTKVMVMGYNGVQAGVRARFRVWG